MLRLLLASACLVLVGTGAEPQATAADRPSLSRMVGESIVGAFAGPSPPAGFVARVRRGELGGVILFADNIGSASRLARTISTLRNAAEEGGTSHLLVVVDQEGGTVRRLRTAPPSASAQTMGRWSPAQVRAEGVLTGRALRSRHIDVDLAPVADVPSSTRSFLGTRAFSRDRRVVATLAPAFAVGLQTGGVAATAKHFPGLGDAPTNTDTAKVVVPTERAQLLRDLLPFQRSVDAGVRLVMVSSATYPSLDHSRVPALFSWAIVTGLLRGHLGFGGVVVTDSMDAPAARGRRNGPARAIEAGVDLLLYTNARSSAAGFRDLLASARTDGNLRASLRSADARILALERWLARDD